MNSEISSTSVAAVRADDHPLAVTTVDHWMRQQDQLNSGDVVLTYPSSAGLREVQPGPGSPAREAPAVPGTRAA
jgi:hypothetical protein